jgi:hypothetical protein
MAARIGAHARQVRYKGPAMPDGLKSRRCCSAWSEGDDIAPPSVLLKVPRIRSGHFGTHYDVSPDGRRIYFLDRKTDPPPPDFNVVLGWPGILKWPHRPAGCRHS